MIDNVASLVGVCWFYGMVNLGLRRQMDEVVRPHVYILLFIAVFMFQIFSTPEGAHSQLCAPLT